MQKNEKKALIFGISGQDGAILASFLCSKGYQVFGTSRDPESNSFKNLRRLNILDKVHILPMSPQDFRSVFKVLLEVLPDEVYSLAGQTSVGRSFEIPAETIDSIYASTLNILEACRAIDHDIRLFNAGSSECFGDTQGKSANENTKYDPKSPYAIAKAASIWLVDTYRESYGLNACSGILFNHESVLRPERFVTQKIAAAAHRISHGSKERLALGNIDVYRDWGWAPEYVEAMWKMLQQKNVRNYIIASGASYSLREFLNSVFCNLDLDWEGHVDIDQSLIRPNEVVWSKADPSKIFRDIGWKARTDMHGVVQYMMQEKNNSSG